MLWGENRECSILYVISFMSHRESALSAVIIFESIMAAPSSYQLIFKFPSFLLGLSGFRLIHRTVVVALRFTSHYKTFILYNAYVLSLYIRRIDITPFSSPFFRAI